jgi:hypothetical protein
MIFYDALAKCLKSGEEHTHRGRTSIGSGLGNPRPILPQKTVKIKPKTQKNTYVGNLQKCNKITKM